SGVADASVQKRGTVAEWRAAVKRLCARKRESGPRERHERTSDCEKALPCPSPAGTGLGEGPPHRGGIMRRAPRRGRTRARLGLQEESEGRALPRIADHFHAPPV